MISRIWKEHIGASGAKKGKIETFVVEPRQRDGMYLVKKLGVKGNRDEFYDKVKTLDEVWEHLENGRSVRMKGQNTGDFNTLNREGAKYA
jgi:uncharacterized protein with NRDE domain